MAMWYWNQDKFEGLQSIIDYLTQSKFADGFNEYCILLEKGLRKQALAALNKFIQEAETWDMAKKRDFVDWVLWVCLSMPDVHGLIPHNLQTKLVEPTLKNWKLDEPSNNRALRWSSELEDIRKAIELDEKDQIAKAKFAVKVLSYADYYTHELPEGFLGEDPNETLAEVVESLKYLEDIRKDKTTTLNSNRLREIEKKLRAYLDEQS